MTAMATTQAGSGGEDTSATRAALLAALRSSPEPMTVQELAVALGLHKNSVRFHLGRLARSGLVHEEQASPTGPGRPRLVYSLVDPSTAVRPGGHQLLAEALTEHLAHVTAHPDEVAIEAGEKQGRRMTDRDPTSRPATEEEGKEIVTALMRDYGFDPAWDPDGQRLWLRTCPFRPLSDHQPAVACSVHLGLMRGALDAAAAPLEVVSLDAAPAPHPCLARFQPKHDTPGQEPH
jgi:predicted ArsR family transcriptional regulator